MESCGKFFISFFVGFICIYCVVDAEALDDSCVYTLYVSTGTQPDAGTDSKISADLFDTYGEAFSIPNLVSWGGLMDINTTKYFERGSVDIFSGRGPCLFSNVCSLKLTSDGTGMSPDWFCNYVSLTSTGDGYDHRTCFQVNFTVVQWIGNKTQPFVIIDNCTSSSFASSSHHYSKNPSAASDPLRFNNILLPIITN